VTFASGARLVLVAPVAVQLASDSEVALLDGQVGAQVPLQAIGFTVDTPALTFVDLGTEFVLTLEKDNSCELQVFDGLVEMQLRKAGRNQAAQELRISEGSAVRFDAAKGNVISIQYDETKQVSF
jgi:ferric-dicitrate binding protein FerR (iron transport regulator)